VSAERLSFPGALGTPLAARLERPDDGALAGVLFAHCFTCSKDLRAAGRLSRRLVEHGLACLRFDFTGIGESEGDFAATTFSTNVDDLVAAAAALHARVPRPLVLLGHSLGGAAVLAAAGRIPEAVLVATLAAPADTAHFRETLLRNTPGLAETGAGEIELGGQRFRIGRALLDDLAGHRLGDAVAALGRPLLIFHSPADRTVGIAQAHRLFELARHPKSLIALPGADHLLMDDPRDADLVADVVAAWARRLVSEQP